MDKFKQCVYTLLLIITCFVASPFILHRIWVTSEAVQKKNNNVAPPVVNIPDSSGDSSGEPSDISVQTPPQNDGPGDVQQPDPEGNGDTVEFTPPETAKQPDFYVPSDISYFDDALFIGDSRTVGIMEYGDFDRSDFFCSQGLSAYKINETEINGMNFDKLIDSKQYGKVYIMLGINEVGMDHEYVLTAYRAIVEKLKVHQPDAIIYVQGNLHVSSYAEDGIITNASINDLNRGIASLADNKRVFYVDINELYDDEYGYFNSGYTSDGVHPLAMYYTQWCEWLCTKTVPQSILDGSGAAEPAQEPTT